MKIAAAFLGLFGLICLVLTISMISASTYEVEFAQVGDTIVIKESVDGLKISNYVSPEKLEKSSAGYYFVKKIVFNESYSKAEIKLNLEEGVILEDSEAYPAGYKTESDGRTISLAWNLENVQKNQVFAIFVKLEDAKRANWAWIIIVMAIAGVLGYLIYSKSKKKEKIMAKARRTWKKPATGAKYEYLLDTEKRVIEELKKADRNELWQKQIQNSTGFSKAKVSRLVRNLESRELIVKIPFGNTNKVRLK